MPHGQSVINLCANNYLGLAQHPEVNIAARDALEQWGYGMASVRFICGTQTLHKTLEDKLSAFLGMEDTILYPSCFDANGGLFETLLTDKDAVISDQLNHASIIDGIRLCKASRYRYKNNDMADLEAQLQAADKKGARFKLISTDGVFSMDGYIARLDEICDLAEKYNALVHFDDAHATGFIGDGGRGTHEYHNCIGRVDIITGTLGKALGGASGGYTSARKEIIELLRQRSRPYLFSNTVAPPVVAGAIKALEQAGRVLAFELEPGMYEISKWKVVTSGGIDFAHFDSEHRPPIAFEVKSGEVSYLCNCHINVDMGENIFGLAVEDGAEAAIYDKMQRDMQYVDEKYPNLRELKVNNIAANLRVIEHPLAP